jgi:hemerythrin-like domain-containing protein
MSTTIELLSTQHQEVLAYLADIETRLQTSDAAAALAAYLHQEVTQHFTLEEHALFPLLAHHLSQVDGPLAVMNAEHESFRELLNALDAAIAAGDARRQQVGAAALIELLRKHIAKEEHVLFPMSLQLLSPEEQRDVDARAAALPHTVRASR